jgi:hypothetical protein
MLEAVSMSMHGEVGTPTNITRRRSVKSFSIPPQHWIDRTTLRAAAQFTNTQTESTGNKLNATMLEFLGSRIRFRRIGRFAENLSEARHVQEIYGSGAVDTEVHGRVGSRTEPTALAFSSRIAIRKSDRSLRTALGEL